MKKASGRTGGRVRGWGWCGLLAAIGLLSGCAATSVLSFAYEQANEGECVSAGCAAKAVLAHAIDKVTEGDPTPCRRLNTVERALSPRCGAYQPGSLLTKDVTASGLPRCPLTLAARDAAFWPMLPELLSKGAAPEACDTPPLVALAQASPCPDFSRASPEALGALRWLAQADAHAIHHDVVRMLSCPAARSYNRRTRLNSCPSSASTAGRKSIRNSRRAPTAGSRSPISSENTSSILSMVSTRFFPASASAGWARSTRSSTFI